MLLEKAKRLIKTISFNCSINLSFLIVDISKIVVSFNAPTLKGLQWNYLQEFLLSIDKKQVMTHSIFSS